jgi:endonuclease/exonuclease/phosphatase family metal-dependent hydrolase
MRSLATGPTFPVQHPTEQLDHVLLRGRLRVDGGRPVRLPLSDHCALVADVG